MAAGVGAAAGAWGYSRPSYKKKYQVLGGGLSRYKRIPIRKPDLKFKSAVKSTRINIVGNVIVNKYANKVKKARLKRRIERYGRV